MNTVLHKAATRGHASHGWLESWHTFSFASYYDPSRMHFGSLRVLNDDTVAPGMGFGKHPHDNMEIISIPLEGGLEHQDNMGTKQIIKAGDVQVMSAGTGIAHSEKNASSTAPVRFLQIWVIPNKKNVPPRYEQKTISDTAKKNGLVTVVSPMGSNSDCVQIYQDAWFSLGDLEIGTVVTYNLNKSGNGVYAFVLDGELVINDIVLERRDGLGISDTDTLTISASADARLLLMEVPLV